MDITELKRLAEKATPGPWEWDADVCNYDPTQEAPWLVERTLGEAILSGQINCDNKANAAFIAAANPAAVLELIEQNADLLHALKSATEELQELKSSRYRAQTGYVIMRCEAVIAKAEGNT